MEQEQQEAYENYLEVVKQENSTSGKKEQAYFQLNIRIKKADKEKLDKIVKQARKTVKIEFNLGGEQVPLDDMNEYRASITRSSIVRHWVLKKIHELAP